MNPVLAQEILRCGRLTAGPFALSEATIFPTQCVRSRLGNLSRYLSLFDSARRFLAVMDVAISAASHVAVGGGPNIWRYLTEGFDACLCNLRIPRATRSVKGRRRPPRSSTGIAIHEDFSATKIRNGSCPLRRHMVGEHYGSAGVLVPGIMSSCRHQAMSHHCVRLCRNRDVAPSSSQRPTMAVVGQIR